ncbi:hypothetical protein [Reyranella aquatilis]|jgi:hypothetical protein|uniref:Prepilin-type N-terminal cleavage/methylation domain-containing protein n=1 Tax=Reyranella aquatilis TaxID=2035356 RepID=A0ABS8L0E8_9HYPH|nr:hypothetical protein [Reyranella aquatilis]MCC8431812.1 hypothetical protein [Reyranella aquatilis]
MQTGQNKPRAIAIPQEYRRMRFSLVDLLVVVAALLTLAVVVDAATGRAKAAPTSTSSLIEAEVSQLPHDTDLLKARIRLATGL